MGLPRVAAARDADPPRATLLAVSMTVHARCVSIGRLARSDSGQDVEVAVTMASIPFETCGHPRSC